MQLIPQWKSSWRFTSLQAGWVLGFFDAVYAADAWGLQEAIGLQWFGVLNAFVVSIVLPWLRNVQQSPPLAPDVKSAIVDHVKDSPTAKPEVVPTQTKISGQAAREYINREIKQEVAAQLAQVRKRKPTAPKTKALAAAFAPPGESTP